MGDQDNILEAMEQMLSDKNAKPLRLSYAFLRNVTSNFSKVIGSGGFGIVYMGVVRNWKLAVKKLSENYDFSEKQFEEELRCLIEAKHRNIVRFLGYCSDTQREMLQHNGRFILADIRQRFLCFEYVPNKSLRDHLKDESHKLEWATCYQIIEGICQGLRYLHNELRINHLDLKPDNILLDDDMVPKITDFGLSRRFSGEYSRIITMNIIGTPGYTAPEYLDNGEISFKSDIFSLGVIIKQLLMRGSYDLSDFENWHQSLDNICCPQMKICIRIARRCDNNDPHKRPTIDRVLEMLNEEDQEIEEGSSSGSEKLPDDPPKGSSSGSEKLPDDPPKGSSSGSEKLPGDTPKACMLLDVYPSVLRFPFMPNKRMKCRVSLVNKTDHYVGFWIIPTEAYTCFCFYFPPRSPIFQMMEPHSSLVRTLKRNGQKQRPPQDTGNFEVLMIIADSKSHLKILKSSIGKQNMDSDFLKQQVEKIGCRMHQAVLTSDVRNNPEDCQGIVTRQVIPTQRFGFVFSMDVHPTQTWILVGYATGFSIIDYQTQETLIGLLRTKRVDSVKFIDRGQWFTVGDENGYARVYTYTTMDTIPVKEFQAYHGKPINLFAVHPTYPFLLSASNSDRSIKLWNWEMGWVCTRTFSVLAYGVLGLTFNPESNDTFASVDTNGTAKVWNIQTSNPTATVRWGKPHTDGYLFTSNGRYFLVTCGSKTYNKNNNAYIWDLEKNECVHRLAVSSQNQTGLIACHPTLPILATRLRSDAVCLWDATNYRFDKVVHVGPGPQDMDSPSAPQHMILTGTNELTRLVVGCPYEISVSKIYLPKVGTDL